jgi:hypothetical protein
MSFSEGTNAETSVDVSKNHLLETKANQNHNHTVKLNHTV